MAFRTENELQAHLDIVHREKGDKVNANALLQFVADPDEEEEGGQRGRGARGRGGRGGRGGRDTKEENFIKDTEGVDFSFYFSEKYNKVHMNRDKKRGDKADRGNRGRGRGGRGGDRDKVSEAQDAAG